MAYQARSRNPLFDSDTQAVIEKRGRELVGLALAGLGIAFALMLGSYVPDDPSWLAATSEPAQNALGRMGASIASPLIVIAGLGAWGIPGALLVWAARFILHQGGERAVTRAVFVPIGVALLSVYLATHAPGPDWGHSFGLGGMFGDMALGALLGVLGISGALGLKLSALVVMVGTWAVGAYVLGFTRAEVSRFGAWLLRSTILTYAGIVTMLGLGQKGVAKGATRGAKVAAERIGTAKERRAARRAAEIAEEQEDIFAAYEPEVPMPARAPVPPMPEPELVEPQRATRVVRPQPYAPAPQPEPAYAEDDGYHHDPYEAAPPAEDEERYFEPAWDPEDEDDLAPEAGHGRDHLPAEPAPQKGFLSRLGGKLGLTSQEEDPMPDDYEGGDRVRSKISDAIRSRARSGPSYSGKARLEPSIKQRRHPRGPQPILFNPGMRPGAPAPQPVAAEPVVEHPAPEAPRAETPRTETTRAETPRAEPQAPAYEPMGYDVPAFGADFPEDAPLSYEASISYEAAGYAAPSPAPRTEPEDDPLAAFDASPEAISEAEPAPSPQVPDATREETPARRTLRRGTRTEPELSRPRSPFVEIEDDVEDDDPMAAFDPAPIEDEDEDHDAMIPHQVPDADPEDRMDAEIDEDDMPLPEIPAPHEAPAPRVPGLAPRVRRGAIEAKPTPTPEKKTLRATRTDGAAAAPSFEDTDFAEYENPPLDLLTDPSTVERHVLSDEALEENARQLETVLDDYGVKGEIVSVRPGPVVTMYELEPAPGLKASRVIGLADDIARSMSALSARVSTVPGRSVIGIELPNEKREMCVLREILNTQDFEGGNARLPLALGKDIGGDPVVANLAKMPHLLIAGTTGSGKSVAINTMILSLLYKLTPEECRMIMIDPKMLELSVYDGIPHLLSPVVTDPKKAVVALKWVVGEMEDRYRKMSKMGVRNIEGYNSRVRDALSRDELFERTVQTGFDDDTGEPIFETEEIKPEILPFIVVVVDEMADLMMVAGKEIEACIQRLAQMARASGIHLIMATQRPSVDVITGTIKANFPTRISFSVTSKIDSRTILGEQGAEQLLGMGDMLYMAGGSKITRVHGPFCSDEEVEEIVNYLKSFGPPDYKSGVVEGPDEDKESDIDAVLGLAGGSGGNGNSEDALYDQAVAIVAKDRKCSTSYIQRKLGIGYNKAARLVEQMEDQGVVSAANHVGKREVLVPEVG